MADKKTEAKAAITKALAAEENPAPAVEASKYTIDELAQAANHNKIFGYTGALVAAALQETGRKKFTVAEAEEIAAAFAKRPVTR